ncbi:MAG: GNVR domain-containing protein [Alphaproteobacteria bacterium]
MLQIRNLAILYLLALWRWRWLALSVAWILCFVGWLAVAMLPDRYTVTARLMVDTETILGPLMKDIAVTPDFDRQVKMIRETLFSKPNMVELIERTGIDRHKNVMTDVEKADLIDELADDVGLDVDSKNLFTITYADVDPDMAYSIVAETMDIFVQKNLGHAQKDVEKASKFIDEQIAIYDEKLRAAELKVAEFKRQHAEELGGAERATREMERAESDLRRLRAELESAIWRRDQLKIKLDSTSRLVSVDDAAASRTGGTVSYLDELRQELARKQLLYTEQHPDILALRKLLADATEQQRQQAATIDSGAIANPVYTQIKEQIEVAEVSVDDYSRRVKTAEDEVANLSKLVEHSPRAEADLKRLTRDYDVLLLQYEQLTKRRESTLLANNLDASRQRAEFRIIDPPTRPLEPSGPLHGLLVVAVLILALGAGVASALLRFLLSGVVMTASQLRGAFKKVPILGGVTVAPYTDDRSSFIRHMSLAGSAAGLFLCCAILVYLYEVSSIDMRSLAPIAQLAALLGSKDASAGL